MNKKPSPISNKMNWPDFQSPPLTNDDLSWNDLFSPAIEVEKKGQWTREEDKLFENAVADFDSKDPAFFENVASRVPSKSIDEIKAHYKALVEDVDLIQSGAIPIPVYETDERRNNNGTQATNGKESPSPSPSPARKKTRNGQNRRRGVPWNEGEHRKFLMGLQKFGRGDWRSISRYYVHSKTPTQVASHAQKYFRRLNSSTPPEKRRPSIHDVQCVHSNFFVAAAASSSSSSSGGPSVNPNYVKNAPPQTEDVFPKFSNNVGNPMFNRGFSNVGNPMFNRGFSNVGNPMFNGGFSNVGNPMFHGGFSNVSNVGNPNFPTIGASFLGNDQVFNQAAPSSSYPPSYMFPSMKNKPWG